MKILMKILKQIKQIAVVVDGWFACSEGRKASPAPELPIKAEPVKPEPTPDETLQKMLNTLVEWKILTPKEAELYLMIEDLPDDIPERLAQMYRDMVEKLKY